MQPKITHLKNKLAGLIALSFAGLIALSNAAGPAAAGHGGRTGASFDSSTCTGCHSGGTYTGVVATAQLLSGTTPVTTYVPGASYTVRIRVGGAGVSSLGYKYGFQTVCIQSSTTNDIADWGTLPTNTHSTTWNSRTYIEQTITLSSSTAATISIPWTAPASGTGDVIFYVAGCVVNNNSLPTGDVGANSSLTVTEGGCVPETLVPSPTDVSCTGYTDGSVDLSASGGSGATGYSWTGPSGYTSTTENITGLAPGVYTVIVTSAGGCTATTTATINEPTAVTATITADTPVCPGATLSFTTTVTGGTGPLTYSYSWTGPNSFSSPLANPNVYTFTATDSGVYTLNVWDANSCNVITTIDVGLSPLPVVALGPDTTICYFAPITLGTAVSGDTYLWSTTDTTSTISVNTTGTYYEVVTNAAGCSSSDTVNIVVNPCEGAVKGVTLNEAISIYPNPASEYITIQNDGSFNIQQVLIYNAYGCLVYTGTLDKQKQYNDIDISHFATGVYNVQIVAEQGVTTRKLIVTR